MWDDLLTKGYTQLIGQLARAMTFDCQADLPWRRRHMQRPSDRQKMATLRRSNNDFLILKVRWESLHRAEQSAFRENMQLAMLAVLCVTRALACVGLGAPARCPRRHSHSMPTRTSCRCGCAVRRWHHLCTTHSGNGPPHAASVDVEHRIGWHSLHQWRRVQRATIAPN